MKTILITGAGSGFGEAVAIGLARLGHNVIATAQFSPHVAALRDKAAELDLNRVRVEKLDLRDPYDRTYALTWGDVDVLWNNAGIGEAGPVCKIPGDLVRSKTMADAPFRWLDDSKNFTRRAAMRATFDSMLATPEGRLDPAEMIARMIEVVPADTGKFRNVCPKVIEDMLKRIQAEAWDRTI